MNCYEHQNVVAVAACSESCGRALCSACASGDDLPRCKTCVLLQQKRSISDRGDDQSFVAGKGEHEEQVNPYVICNGRRVASTVIGAFLKCFEGVVKVKTKNVLQEAGNKLRPHL